MTWGLKTSWDYFKPLPLRARNPEGLSGAPIPREKPDFYNLSNFFVEGFSTRPHIVVIDMVP